MNPVFAPQRVSGNPVFAVMVLDGIYPGEAEGGVGVSIGSGEGGEPWNGELWQYKAKLPVVGRWLAAPKIVV